MHVLLLLLLLLVGIKPPRTHSRCRSSHAALVRILFLFGRATTRKSVDGKDRPTLGKNRGRTAGGGGAGRPAAGERPKGNEE
jgi:hypothetical protein